MSEDTDDHDTPRKELRSTPELAAIFNFLQVFRPVLRLGLEFPAEDLEAGLLSPNAVLADLHIGLMKGIPPSSRTLDRTTWTAFLCAKIKDRWWQVAEGDLPWTPAKGEEAATYKGLSWRVRVHILKALCEVRLDCEDIKDYIEASLKSGTVDIGGLRLDPLGVDSGARKYWYDTGNILGCRLYREEPALLPVLPKGSRGRRKAEMPPPPGAGKWEVVAITLPEFQNLEVSLSSTRARADARIAKAIREHVIPEVEEKERKRDRQAKRQQRQAMLLIDHLHGSGLAAGRAKRERKPVNYTFDDYDKIMSEATGDRRKRRGSPSPEPGDQGHGHPTHTLTREERLKLRRGEAIAEEQAEQRDPLQQQQGAGSGDNASENEGERAEPAGEVMAEKPTQSTRSGRPTQKPARHAGSLSPGGEADKDSEEPESSGGSDDDEADSSRRTDDDEDYAEEEDVSEEEGDDELSDFEEDADEDGDTHWGSRPKRGRQQQEVPPVGTRRSERSGRQRRSYAAMDRGGETENEEEQGEDVEEVEDDLSARPRRTSTREQAAGRGGNPREVQAAKRNGTKQSGEDDEWKDESDGDESSEREDTYDDEDEASPVRSQKQTGRRGRQKSAPQIKNANTNKKGPVPDWNTADDNDDYYEEGGGIGTQRSSHQTAGVEIGNGYRAFD